MLVENWNIEAETGYKPITTFYTDFSLAEKFGIPSVKDTYKRAFEEWKGNYKYITELVMALNWKGWRWYDAKRYDLADVYFELYREVDEWCCENLEGEELDYYYRTTD